MQVHITQSVNVRNSLDYLDGPDITLPCQPQIGMGVASLVIRRILVCQGDPERIDVIYRSVDEVTARILEGQGWTREVVKVMED